MSTNTTAEGKVTKERKKSKSDWRPGWDVPGHAEQLVKAAQLLGDSDISEPADFFDTGYTEDRRLRAEIAFRILDQVLDRFISSASAIELGEGPEPFFERARREPSKKMNEIIDQRSAIADFLGIERPVGKESIVISEADLVAHALKAAKALNYSDSWGIEEMLHEGLRRVAQELISNAALQNNRKPDAPKSVTAPGLNWALYQEKLDQLIEDQGTDRWTGRNLYITVSKIATKSETNDVQIRRWIKANNIPTFPPPEKGDDDQMLAGKIVDPQLRK